MNTHCSEQLVLNSCSDYDFKKRTIFKILCTDKILYNGSIVLMRYIWLNMFVLWFSIYPC